MENETNLKADAGDAVNTSSEKQEDVSQAKDLGAESPDEAFYKELTGREDIKSKEDFQKHYDGLKSLVGDQKVAEMRKKSESYDKLQGEVGKETDEFLKTPEGKQTLKEFASGAKEERLDKLEEEILSMRFLKKNPEVEPFMDLIKVTAQAKGISYEDAFENHLKDLVATKLETEKTKAEEKSIGVESKAGVAPGNQAEVSQLIKAVEETDSNEAKQKLVEKTLGLSQ